MLHFVQCDDTSLFILYSVIIFIFTNKKSSVLQKKEEEKTKLSKRKLKKLTRLSVAELKQLVNRPDVVEMHDVTARDPKLLVQLKAHRNTVPVPRHWCFKRKVGTFELCDDVRLEVLRAVLLKI